MISKKEFEQMIEMQSERFTLTQKTSESLTTDYNVLVVKTDRYSVSIERETQYENEEYCYSKDAVDRLVIETYEELEWLIKATMKYDNERTV
jgi:hypothetical protein